MMKAQESSSDKTPPFDEDSNTNNFEIHAGMLFLEEDPLLHLAARSIEPFVDEIHFQNQRYETLPDPDEQIAGLRRKLKTQIEEGFADDVTVRQQARAAYLAICLDMVNEIRSKDAGSWKQALDALKEYPKLLDVLFNKSPGPAGDKLRAAALAAGLKKP